MEEKKHNETIKDKLAHGDSSKKKIVIKKKSAASEVQSSNVAESKLKAFDEKLKEGMKQQQNIAPTTSSDSGSSHSKQSESIQHSEKLLSEKHSSDSRGIIIERRYQQQTSQQSSQSQANSQSQQQHHGTQSSQSQHQSSQSHEKSSQSSQHQGSQSSSSHSSQHSHHQQHGSHSGHNKGNGPVPFRNQDRDPIVSRPQKPVISSQNTQRTDYPNRSYNKQGGGTGGGYQGGGQGQNRPYNKQGGGTGGGYQGGGQGQNRPYNKQGGGTGGGYQGGGQGQNRPYNKQGGGTGGGYQGGGQGQNRPYNKQGGGTGGGYQGGGQGQNRRPMQGGGNRPMQGGGNYKKPGGTGGRGEGFSPPPIELPKESGPTINRKRNNSSFEKSRDKALENLENTKFFKQMYKKPSPGVIQPISTIPKEINIMENIQVGELAKKLNLKPNDVIAKLMKMGVMVTINNVIDSDTASILADEFGCKVKIISLYEETVIPEEKDNKDEYIHRPPVVTIMGHVDHGKTKLLDTIRKSSVIDTEAGGITQHIGAYQVHTPRGVITFLDTPGHEAFTAMRARGAKVTDIVILVVAADDGVMPQTIEAINHAKDAKVPIIVAINKIDLPTANPDKVLQELSNYGLQAEEWGGTTIVCKISARQNIGIDKLLEMILIQAEVLELTANPGRRGRGTIIEAKLDPGRGPIATVLIQNGTLRIGDAFVAGVHSGRVRAMFDDYGHNMEEAGPSCPVLVTGLDAVPDAGDPFDSIEDEKDARNISQHRKEYKRIGQAAAIKRVTLDNMNEIIQQGELKELKIIIKTDVHGSAEALKEALEKLSNTEIKLNVIHAGTGAIVDTDVMLASASNALIIGFHVRANPRTLALAEKESVQIKYYSIIYDVVNEIKSAMEGMLEPEKIESIIGKVEIRDIFKISKVGNIAGCMVTSGKITKNSMVRVLHENVVIFDGRLKSLKRVKDDVSEVLTGFECGILLDGFNEFNVGDEIEVYEISSVARKLK